MSAHAAGGPVLWLALGLVVVVLLAVVRRLLVTDG